MSKFAINSYFLHEMLTWGLSREEFQIRCLSGIHHLKLQQAAMNYSQFMNGLKAGEESDKSEEKGHEIDSDSFLTS